MPRIRSVTLDANGNDPVNSEAIIDLLTMLSLFVPSRYRCRLQTDRGLVFDDNFFAVGVKHTITAEQWTAEISLDRSDPFELLNGTDYRWNVATWDGALWN